MIVFLIYTAVSSFSTLSLHDALPILVLLFCPFRWVGSRVACTPRVNTLTALAPESRTNYFDGCDARKMSTIKIIRSEEHTSELQSRQYLVCRLLLEKKKICKD